MLREDTVAYLCLERASILDQCACEGDPPKPWMKCFQDQTRFSWNPKFEIEDLSWANRAKPTWPARGVSTRGPLLYHVFGFGNGSPSSISASFISWGSKNPPLMTQLPFSPIRVFQWQQLLHYWLAFQSFERLELLLLGLLAIQRIGRSLTSLSTKSNLSRCSREWTHSGKCDCLSHRCSLPTITAFWVTLSAKLPSSVLLLI